MDIILAVVFSVVFVVILVYVVRMIHFVSEALSVLRQDKKTILNMNTELSTIKVKLSAEATLMAEVASQHWISFGRASVISQGATVSNEVQAALRDYIIDARLIEVAYQDLSLLVETPGGILESSHALKLVTNSVERLNVAVGTLRSVGINTDIVDKEVTRVKMALEQFHEPTALSA